MRNNKGVTLISLIVSIVLITILATTTIVTSLNSYNQMKFEGAKAEIEQMQKRTDEIAVDYQSYLQEEHEGTTSYLDYFQDRYRADFSSNLLSTMTDTSKVSAILDKDYFTGSTITEKKKYHEGSVFYFSSNDLNKYFDLKGIDDVLVDFSTRKVYSVSGITDPSDKTKIYYTASDWGENTVITTQVAKTNTQTITANLVTKSGTNYDIEITSNVSYNHVAEVYAFTKEGSNVTYTKIDNFRIIGSDSKEMRVVVAGSGSYYFRIVDDLNNYVETTSVVTCN